jgi:hypothetical protein
VRCDVLPGSTAAIARSARPRASFTVAAMSAVCTPRRRNAAFVVVPYTPTMPSLMKPAPPPAASPFTRTM